MYILYILYTYIYICVYVYKSFSTMLDKGLGKNNHKKRYGEIGKHKLNELEAMNMRETNSLKVKHPHIVQSFLNTDAR